MRWICSPWAMLPGQLARAGTRRVLLPCLPSLQHNQNARCFSKSCLNLNDGASPQLDNKKHEKGTTDACWALIRQIEDVVRERESANRRKRIAKCRCDVWAALERVACSYFCCCSWTSGCEWKTMCLQSYFCGIRAVWTLWTSAPVVMNAQRSKESFYCRHELESLMKMMPADEAEALEAQLK